MPNEFLTTQSIARQALPRLIENLVFPNLIHKDYSNEFTNKGAKIQVRKPVKLTAEEFDAATGTKAQDITESSVDVVLDKIATVDVEITAIQGATNIDDLNRVFVEPAAVALAEKINGDGLFLYRDVPTFCGTAGTTPAAVSDIAAARKQLNVQKVPTTGRIAVWDPEADGKLAAVKDLINAEKSGNTQALKEGSMGRVMGFENYMSQAVKAHKTGITSATAVKVSAAVSEGATQLAIGGTALVGKLVKGDLIKIGEKTYTVTQDTDDAASNAIASVKVYPALPAIAANTAVTLTGSHVANLAFVRQAFGFVTRPLVKASGVECYVTNYNGITLRVTKGYDMKFKKEMLSMDVLYGYVTLYPELATRILG